MTVSGKWACLATGGLLAFTCLVVPSASSVRAADLDLPMDRGLISIAIRCGLKATESETWKGSFRLNRGTFVATDGLRFTGSDFADASSFQFDVRRYYPRFWNRRGRDPSSLPLEPNGFILTLKDITAASVLEVESSQGNFSIPLAGLGYSGPKLLLDGRVQYQRVPTSRQFVQAETEDAYPAALVDRQGALCVAFIAFEHGEGFQTRLPVPTAPNDFGFLARPAGGDRIMFTQCRDGSWSQPVALTPTGDLLGVASAEDGEGRLWIVWAQNVKDNWDLYAAVRQGAKWSDPLRVTSQTGSDFHPALATDADGRVWIAWQSFADGHSEILAARQDGTGFGSPQPVATSPANDWTPAIAAAADGRIAIAWDSYEGGNYNVSTRIWQDEQWKPSQLVAGSAMNETRATAAFDRTGRLWVAYEVSPEGWGKDYGPYDQRPKNMPLYRSRSIGVRVLHAGSFYRPAADVNASLPMPTGQPRYPKSGDAVRAASPKLVVDQSGRIWLSARCRVERLDNTVGGCWLTFLTTLDATKWRKAIWTPESDGYLHETSSLAPAPGSGLYVVSCSDGRFRAAASFGQPGRVKAAKGNKPASTRTYGDYADRNFNKELAVADTGRLAAAAGEPDLVSLPAEAAVGPSPAAKAEAAHVAAMRDYRAEIGGKTFQLSRGEFHRHTEFSSDGAGDGSIYDMWRYGIDTAALDWIGNGDHDNGNGREFSWWYTQKTTSLFQVPGAFSPMYTYERSCNYPDGHRNAVFAQRGVRPLPRLQGGLGKAMDNLPPDAERPPTPDTEMFYRYLHYFDGVCASHTSGTDMGTDWRNNDPKVEPIVEIYQGDRQSYERPDAPRSNTANYSIGGWRPMGFVANALMKGYRLGFQASSDHISTHMSYCNVWVEEPTREAILEGMKKRRVYGSTDNIIADVRCGEHFMGEEFATDKKPTLQVKLIGTAAFEEVVIVKDNEYVYSMAPNRQAVEFQWTDMAAEPGKTSYYYIRGKQVGQKATRNVKGTTGRLEVEFDDGEIVWVSPMWITYQPQ